MERLTDKIGNTNCVKGCGSNCKYGFQYCCKEDWENCQTISDVIDKLAYYEDLEEQGRLIKLPCKVGDIVYIAETVLAEAMCIRIQLDGDRNGIWINAKEYPYDRRISFKAFGKTVFLTKSEAEAKLKELRGEQNGKI